MTATVIAASWGGTASAHGPCGCLDPRLAEEGRRVGIAGDYPVHRVVFNPRPTGLGIAPPYLASAYRADVPTTTVVSRPRRAATANGRFRIPDGTPPGIYLVLVFDRGEGGAHNTWDYVHVIPHEGEKAGMQGVVARREAARPPGEAGEQGSRQVEESDRSTPWPLLVAAAVGGGVVGAGLATRVRTRRA